MIQLLISCLWLAGFQCSNTESPRFFSQFTVPQEELRQILQSKEVVSTPITKILPSADGPRYVREVDLLGRSIGTDKFNNFSPTSKMSVLTDGAGNLVSAFPGVIK